MRYRTKAADGRLLRTCDKAELEAIELLTAQGYNIFKRGWPDLLAVKEGERPRLIEVKSRTDGRFKNHQFQIAEQLKKLGLDVELVAPPFSGLREGKGGVS